MTRDEMDAAIEECSIGLDCETLYVKRQLFLAGMAAAADIVEQSWKDGYRGEVTSGFKFAILRVANRLSLESE